MGLLWLNQAICSRHLPRDFWRNCSSAGNFGLPPCGCYFSFLFLAHLFHIGSPNSLCWFRFLFCIVFVFVSFLCRFHSVLVFINKCSLILTYLHKMLKRGVSRVVEACLNPSTKMSTAEHVAYENEWSFSLRLLYNRQKNGYKLSLGTKQHRVIECLANNYKSSCMLAHGYRKKRWAPHIASIEAEWTYFTTFFLLQIV